MNVRFPPKPGHLPLGIVSVSLLCSRDGMLQCDLSAQMLHCLFIAQRAERPRRGAITFSQGARFLQNAGREHFARSMINALVKRFPVRTQADAENIKAEEWIAAFLPETGHRSPR